MRTLIVPGLNGSGPKHWQTLWEERYGFERIQQRDWENPDAAEWVQNLNAAIMKHSGKVILVAHSLGSLTVIKWTELYAEHTKRVQSALLVTPPDISSTELNDSVRGFALLTPRNLPFPSILVGSENDPYMALNTAKNLALALGSSFVNAGRAGHININSGNGPWPLGEVLLLELLAGSFKNQEISTGAHKKNHFNQKSWKAVNHRASQWLYQAIQLWES